MNTLIPRGYVVVVACIVVGLLPGCGKTESSAAVETASQGESAAPPTASIRSPANASPKNASSDPEADADAGDAAEADEAEESGEPDAEIAELKEGTPEWLVREATRLRLEPPPKTDDIEKLKAHRKERNEKIIQCCQKAIAQIHENAEKARLFDMAVRSMLDARLQLALSGDRDSIDTLYADAEALAKRDPKSAAAAEGAHTLVNLAYSRAKLGASDQKQWLDEFAKQAMHFAEAFPAEERRSVPLLFTAARSCELADKTAQAVAAYTLIEEKFPQSAYAARVAGILRRLKLAGNPPQLAGPSLSGDLVVLDDLLGKVVLVVFWSTEARPFVSELPALLEVTRAHEKQGLEVVGINLDQDATAVRQFAVEHRIAWPQIFFTEPEKKGWNNPIASYYGIMELPSLWLIDQSGNVVSTTITVASLGAEVQKLLARSASKGGASNEKSGGDGDKKASLRRSRKEPNPLTPKVEEDE